MKLDNVKKQVHSLNYDRRLGRVRKTHNHVYEIEQPVRAISYELAINVNEVAMNKTYFRRGL